MQQSTLSKAFHFMSNEWNSHFFYHNQCIVYHFNDYVSQFFFFRCCFFQNKRYGIRSTKKKKFFINRFDYHINGLDVSAKEITRAKYNAHDGLISLLCQIHCLVTENYCMTFSEPNGSRCVCVCEARFSFTENTKKNQRNFILFSEKDL